LQLFQNVFIPFVVKRVYSVVLKNLISNFSKFEVLEAVLLESQALLGVALCIGDQA
jgi:hypothetical protein